MELRCVCVCVCVCVIVGSVQTLCIVVVFMCAFQWWIDSCITYVSCLQ